MYNLSKRIVLLLALLLVAAPCSAQWYKFNWWKKKKKKVQKTYMPAVVKPVYTVSGTVFLIHNNDTSILHQDSEITLTYLTDSGEVKAGTINTKYNGTYKFDLEPNKDYYLDASTRVYHSDLNAPYFGSTANHSESFDTVINLYVHTWGCVEIPGVFFDRGSTDLRADAKAALDSVWRILKIHPYLVVELSAHTDCRGDATINYKLSVRRSNTCRDYLISKGIDPDRLIAKGYGETKLLNNCGCEPGNNGPGKDCTEEEHQINRRAVVSIVGTDYCAKTTNYLSKIRYDHGKISYRPEFDYFLTSVATVMKEYPEFVLVINSFPDTIDNGYEIYSLSHKRALYCRFMLIRHGIAPDRIISIGHSSTRFRNKSKSEPDSEEGAEIDTPTYNVTVFNVFEKDDVTAE